MKQQDPGKVYCTNMEKDDPVIKKFMEEYYKEKRNAGEVPKANDLIVNFNISYEDGEEETYTCGADSGIFGKGEEYSKSEKFIEKNEKSKEEKQCNCKIEENKHKDIKKDKAFAKEYNNEYEHYYEKEKDNKNNYEEYFMDFEPNKWANCSDEWCECNGRVRAEGSNHYQYNKNEKKEAKKECKKSEKNKCKGKITVYSILSCEHSQTLKGVKINLYEINGVTPKLVASKNTDSDGKVVFSGIENGCYRVIEIIDKSYFEKPTYLTWNEFNINAENTSGILYVLNYLKQFRKY